MHKEEPDFSCPSFRAWVNGRDRFYMRARDLRDGRVGASRCDLDRAPRSHPRGQRPSSVSRRLNGLRGAPSNNAPNRLTRGRALAGVALPR
jgi:hypothetical protein